MGKRVVVFDFDNTVTKMTKEADFFVENYPKALAKLVGITPEALSPALERMKLKIGDPFLRMMEVAKLIFDQHHLYQNLKIRDDQIQRLFRDNHQNMEPEFREKAGATLVALMAEKQVSLYIVSNSSRESISQKLGLLCREYPDLIGLENRVFSSAEKYVLGNKPRHLTSPLQLPGADPIDLRRPRYYEILKRLCQINGVGWSDMTVIGDVFELDLALPFALGAKIGLVQTKYTLDPEKKFVEANTPRATLITSLDEVLPFVMK